MLLPIGFNHWRRKRRNMLENELTSSLQDDEIKTVIYGMIDRSLFLSFIGGVFLGILPFLFLSNWVITSIFCLGVSLMLFFLARYSGLKFLFEEESDEEEEE